MTTWTSKFHIEQAVTIDQDRSMTGYITAVIFRRDNYVDYEISYIHNGEAKSIRIEEFRIELK